MQQQQQLQHIFDLLTELWNTGRPDVLAQVYSEQVVRTDPNQSQPTRGLEPITRYVAEVRTGFPDFKLEIKQRISEGDLVSTQWTCTGTHDGEFQGIPPTGRRVQIDGATVDRIADGRIVEERAYFDRFDLFQQLGIAAGGAQGATKTAGRA